ncbi:DUF1524 domain-containing protein [Demequina sp. SYSU T00068]|uniref:GmrSD restriction endonuclease domain-containing protein n=1 Tax=Demequina lignilytica TaxID=3051663 RepID=UPI00261A5AB4|nr:DUF1524 domain-containing protein [Demequina sp. SYSU T00068]MDN4489588.1 DUF1524 domain-containing protein [Demequina sp. SYSU T00068]
MRWAGLLGAMLGAGLLAGCASAAAPLTTAQGADVPSAPPSPAATGGASAAPASSASPATTRGTAYAAALDLTVKGRAPQTGYSRDQFGSGWVDVDRNGCDTRNDMLRLRLTGLETSGPCTVLAGVLEDPFTGTLIRFEKGGASEVDIDHLVALSDAWQKGAAQWPFAKRVAFANDPLNLEPVDAGENRAKGDGDAATWLPPATGFRCAYVARQVAVKAKYEVWVTRAELDAMLRVLDACPGHPLPAPGDQPVLAQNTGGPAPTPAPPVSTSDDALAPTGEGDVAVDPRYDTCQEAAAAGYGPYVDGVDAEYGWYRDGDRDGTVCER